MANYLRPDIYVEEISTGEKPIQSVATSVGAFIGRTPRGEVGKAIEATSWTDYVNKFSLGCASPFLPDTPMSNSVFGFFQNGGAKCKIVRVASPTAIASKVTLATDGLEINAKEVGEWGNKLSITVKENGDNTFTLQVYANKELVETLEELSNTVTDPNYFVTVINETSKFITVASETDKLLVVTASPVVFENGTDSNASITDNDYIGAKGLLALDLCEDVNLVAIPGVSAEVMVGKTLVEYCDLRNDCFAIIDCKANTVEDAVTFRKALGGTNGAVYFPYGKVADPLGRTSSSLKSCPPSGHVMGVYARVDNVRGVYKAPAGEECGIRGFVSLNVTMTKTDLETLNPIGVNCIIAKPNKGIIIWGARTLSDSLNKRYVSDVRYDLMVRKSLYEGTQWAIFEPNDDVLWDKVTTSLVSFLDTQWRSGALRGTSPGQAYYVKCDADLNTTDTINLGQLISEIGYAKQKPTEFAVIKIVQKQNSN